jgi:hypothetical protein
MPFNFKKNRGALHSRFAVGVTNQVHGSVTNSREVLHVQELLEEYMMLPVRREI